MVPGLDRELPRIVAIDRVDGWTPFETGDER